MISEGQPLSEELQVKIKLLTEDAVVPMYAMAGDGACDLCSVVNSVIPPLSRVLVPTGISLEVPGGYGAFVVPRSGLAINHGITCLNSPGLIDSGYRGEVKVILFNSDDKEPFSVRKGDRIAQLVVVALPRISFSVSEQLSQSARGEGGFGHTGIRNF